MNLILPSQALVLNAYAVLVGAKPGNAALKEHQAYIAATSEASYKAALESFAASSFTPAALATAMLNNLGLSAIFSQADAEAYLAANPGNRVGAMMDLAATLYAYNGTDASLLAAKTAYQAKITDSYSYSINAANINSQGFAGTGPQTYTLSTGMDNVVASAADDAINGSVQQNQNGANVNSFSTGDTIDGGAGTDTITATLINDRIVESGTVLDINVKTMNVEIAKFEVLDEGVVVDAGNMDSVSQFWSVNSDDSGLRIEDVRLGSKLAVTKDITFGMKDVDFESDLTALFDSNSLRNAGTTQSNSQILVEVGYEDTPSDVNNTNPTKDLFLKISFTHDGKAFDSGFLTTTGSTTYTNTYAGLKDLLAATLATQGFSNLVVEFGADFTSITTDAGVKPLQVIAKQIFIKDPAGKAFTAVTSSAGANSSDPTSDVASRILPIDPNTATTLIESNLILDNAGRGSTAGDVVIGAMSNSNAGVEKFNVMVDRDSAIESLNTTNGKLKVIAITSLTGKGDLEVGSTQAGLTLIDASAFAGGDLMLGTTAEANRLGNDETGLFNPVSVAPVDNLKTLSANVAANVTFNGSTTEANGVDTDQAYSYTTGSGKDTVNFTLDGDSVDAEAESFTLTTNSGDDTVTMKMDVAGGVSQGTMSILKNLKIDTGSGADTVNLDSYGNFSITTGDDSDYVRINSVDDNGNATTGVITVGNTTGVQNWGGAAVDARVLYQAKLTVTFAGLESTVNITTTAADKFVATQLTINAAIKAAIAANPLLAKLVSATDVNGTEQLRITSKIGGDNDISIDVYQPKLIATGTAVAGEVLINSGDVTALRQGLLATDAYDASFAYDSEDLETAAEIAAVTSTAGENFYGSVSQAGQGNEDSVYSPNLNATEKTGAQLVASGAYAYLNDANGGQNFGTDATVDVNFSTVNLGNGSNDLLVVHSNDLSMNTIVIDGVFGKNTIVNFHDLSPNVVNVDKNNVGLHQLDFTKLLTNQTDPSTATGGNANNTDSAKAIAVTLHDAGNTFTANVTAANDVFATANSVNVLHFNENIANSVKFADFTGSQLKDKLNDQAGTVTTVVGGLNDTSLTIVEAGTSLVGTTQHHVFMVENVNNLGEYKVFKATSTLDSTDKTKLVDSDADDFTNVDLLGTLDFGYSINFNLAGAAGTKALLSGLIASADTGSTVTVQGVPAVVASTANGINPNAVVATYAVTAAAASVNEGASVAFNLATTNVPDGTVLSYTIGGAGVTVADSGVPLAGQVTVVGNAATVTVAPTSDASTEGAETLTLSIANSSASVVINDTSVPVTVNTVAVNAAGTSDASAANVVFNVALGNYSHTITGFAAGDKLAFPAGQAASVDNGDYTDGAVNLTYASGGQLVTISLTGLTNAQDVSLNGTADFNALFGAGTLV